MKKIAEHIEVIEGQNELTIRLKGDTPIALTNNLCSALGTCVKIALKINKIVPLEMEQIDQIHAINQLSIALICYRGGKNTKEIAEDSSDKQSFKDLVSFSEKLQEMISGVHSQMNGDSQAETAPMADVGETVCKSAEGK